MPLNMPRSLIIWLNLFASLLLASAQIVFAQRYPAQDTLAIAAPYPAYMSDLAKEDVQGVFTGGTDVGKVKTGADTTAHRVNFDIPAPCRECSFAADAGGKGGTISFGGGKKLPIKTVLSAPLKMKVNALRENIQEKITQSISNPQK